jgi:hypothetical protein
MIPILRVWSAECVLEKAPPAGTKRALESPVQSPAKRSAVASGARVFFFSFQVRCLTLTHLHAISS